MAKLTWHGPQAKTKLKGAAGDGLFEAAEYGLETANRTIPIEEGSLQRSGSTSIDRDSLIAHISYDTPYAIVQHENMNYRHDPGRRAKWLELTMQEERDAIQTHIANRMKGAL